MEDTTGTGGEYKICVKGHGGGTACLCVNISDVAALSGPPAPTARGVIAVRTEYII